MWAVLKRSSCSTSLHTQLRLQDLLLEARRLKFESAGGSESTAAPLLLLLQAGTLTVAVLCCANSVALRKFKPDNTKARTRARTHARACMRTSRPRLAQRSEPAVCYPVGLPLPVSIQLPAS